MSAKLNKIIYYYSNATLSLITDQKQQTAATELGTSAPRTAASLT